MVIAGLYLDFLLYPGGMHQLNGDDADTGTALAKFLEIVNDETIVPLIQNEVQYEAEDRCVAVSPV